MIAINFSNVASTMETNTDELTYYWCAIHKFLPWITFKSWQLPCEPINFQITWDRGLWQEYLLKSSMDKPVKIILD